MTRVPSRVSVRLVFCKERVVHEAHGLSGEVGAEGMVEAGVDRGPSQFGIGVDLRSVDPGATNLIASLEDNHGVALAAELTSSDKAGGSGANHCHVT